MNNETIPFEESLFVNQSGKYILSILNEDVKSSSWLLTNGIHKIGRLDDKEIILDDVTVSRNHGYITEFIHGRIKNFRQCKSGYISRG